MIPRILSFEPPCEPEFDGEPASWGDLGITGFAVMVVGLGSWGGVFAYLFAWKMGWL